jgi:hypothetical protein
MSAIPRTDRDFERFLVSHGLTAVASEDTMQDWQRHRGRRLWFDFQYVIDLPPVSLFPEQTEPFFFVADRTCLIPPNTFECDFDYHRDGPRTHAVALDRMTALFGTPERGVSVNTLSETWKFERMSLGILTFLRENTAKSPLYEKHPELWNFCRISIARNWVRTTSEAEASLLRSLGPSEICQVDSVFAPRPRYSGAWDRGLFRFAANPALSRADGPFFWKRGAALGWCAGQWSAFFERPRCVGLRLEQVEPDRSPGYSRLLLTLPNPFSLEQEAVDTALLEGKEMHDLDNFAPEIARFWELPLRIDEYPAW